MAKIITEHRDILGNVLKEGDCVAASRANMLSICVVMKLLPKQIRIKDMRNSRTSMGFTIYSINTVLIDESDALSYKLKL